VLKPGRKERRRGKRGGGRLNQDLEERNIKNAFKRKQIQTNTKDYKSFFCLKPWQSIFHKIYIVGIGVGQGVAMDSLNYKPGMLCSTLLHPARVPPLKRPYGTVLGVARPQGGLRPAAIFYPFGHPTPYTYNCRKQK
jgi:hypothetical protein